MSRIAVIYLARFAEGFGAIEAFAKSYRDHPADEAHDLILLCKGFSKPGEIAAARAIFDGIPHEIIAVDDEIGFDIHAYKVAADQLDHEFVCFLNTHTRLEAEGWLRKLFANLCRPDVGLVGASGSFESLYSSYKVITRVSWCWASGAVFDRNTIKSFAWIVNGPATANTSRLRTLYRRLRRTVGNYVYWRPTLAELGERFDSIWCSTISPTGSLSVVREFPHFPNPHIRTNVFMLRREDFLEVALADQKSKIACSGFESGYNGLSRTIRGKGLRLVIVGANGVGYGVEQWPASGGFRSGDQSNLLASDNQTRSFANMLPAEKATHVTLTWGGYEPGAPDCIDLLGVRFANERRLSEIGRAPEEHYGRDRTYTIAIPTHNRLKLVLDAIKTVRHQNYENWKIVVFDNASTQPIGDAIRKLNDPRIRCERSDQFLPVTESWNRALDLADGDYVTLIGDDDGLAPRFFERLNQLADQFDEPDAVFSSLYQFIHPGVSPHNRSGFVADLRMASFFGDRDYPFLIDKETARRAVDGSLSMRRSFMFNMPAFTVRRDFLDSLRRDGKVLHSPFPDYYFANLVLEKANKVVGEPRPIAFQGVSRASFGFTLINGITDEGFKVLGHDAAADELLSQIAHHMLPGPTYNSQYILTMAYLAREIGDPSRQPDFARYRKVQILHYLRSQGSMLRWPLRPEGRAFWALLSREEKIWALRANLLHKLSTRVRRGFSRQFSKIDKSVSPYAFQPAQIVYNSGDFVTGFDVFEALDQGSLIDGKRQPRRRARRAETVLSN